MSVDLLRGTLARRGGRVAEGARLESVYTGNRIVGSNPTPSASFPACPEVEWDIEPLLCSSIRRNRNGDATGECDIESSA